MINVAVIGVGMMGHHHARNYSALEEANLVAVCDLDKKTGQKVANTYNTKFYSNYKDLIKKEKLDAVSIAVPTKLHKRVALDFINNGISVLIEKPLASTVKEAEEIVNLADKKNVKLLVGHIERYNPAVDELKKLIELRLLGDILSVVVKRVGIYPPRIKDVNVVTDLAVHDLDIVTNILGRLPNSVLARGGDSSHDGVEDHTDIFLDYGNTGCFIQVNWVTPVKIRNLTITGTKGYAELSYITQKLDLYQQKRETSVDELHVPKEFDAFVKDLGKFKKTEFRIKIEEPLKLEITNFLNAVQGKEPLKVTAKEGVRAIMLAEAVTKSIRKKKEIKFK